MGVTQKQFDDFRAYMERRFAEMLANMPNPPVRDALAENKDGLQYATLTEDLVKPSSATATILGSTRTVEVGSFVLEDGEMVSSGAIIVIARIDNPQGQDYPRYQLAIGRCSQVTEAP